MLQFVLIVNPVPISIKARVRPKPDAKALIDEFLAARVHHVPGAMISFGDFRAKFNEWSSMPLSPYAISRALPDRHASGVHNQNKSFLINASWTPQAPGVPLVIIGGRIKRKV